MEYGKAVKHHEVRMLNRKSLDITGVSNVESFDNEAFLLVTECGLLAIKGHQLHMKNLSLEQGIVTIEGHIDSLVYMDGSTGTKSKGLLGKLFK
ncbi:MAG: sporulation protein YabP [Candidatus Cohnella colombiensis]|uniref:Sporulation protein YabP n=1 Tax=Candidatus Cohnella colombiensis TaxID=3121368 RepID=A0AA95EWZ2_9BACL|nr:MAG: sporulation protein YabP [Cohnella sp.]